MSKDVESQGMMGSCVTNAITSAIEYISNRATKQFFPMSRLFLYYTARSYGKENGKITDEGCSIVKALLAAQSQGICLESAWPYDTEKVNAKPNAYAFVEAEKYKIDEFLKINPVLDLAKLIPFLELHNFKSLINKFQTVKHNESNKNDIKSRDLLKKINEIKMIEFDHNDVVRHPLVSKIIQAYQKMFNDKN